MLIFWARRKIQYVKRLIRNVNACEVWRSRAQLGGMSSFNLSTQNITFKTILFKVLLDIHPIPNLVMISHQSWKFHLVMCWVFEINWFLDSTCFSVFQNNQRTQFVEFMKSMFLLLYFLIFLNVVYGQGDDPFSNDFIRRKNLSDLKDTVLGEVSWSKIYFQIIILVKPEFKTFFIF